jgi:hypothetical protein
MCAFLSLFPEIIVALFIVIANSLYLSFVIGEIFKFHPDYIMFLLIIGNFMVKYENDFYPKGWMLYALGCSFLLGGIVTMCVGVKNGIY